MPDKSLCCELIRHWSALQWVHAEHYTGHIQGQEQACVAMVKMKSKMQSCKESRHWLRSRAWDCDACCQLANGMAAEFRLLLRRVAWNRVSWVFSLSLSFIRCLSLTFSPSFAGALFPSLSLPASPSQFLAHSRSLSCCSLCLCPH